MTNTLILINVLYLEEDAASLEFCSPTEAGIDYAAAKAYKSDNYCAFLLTSKSHVWICFYGLLRDLEENPAFEVIEFLRDWFDEVELAFPLLPKLLNVPPYGELVSISFLRMAFLAVCKEEPSMCYCAGPEDFVNQLWNAITHCKDIPLSPWDKDALFPQLSALPAPHDTQKEKQRLKQLENRVEKLEYILQGVTCLNKSKGINN